MEKWFQPNKWFVLFCGLLVVVYFSLQYVVNQELCEMGKMVATQVFTWEWPRDDDKLVSSCRNLEAHVVKRGADDAVVEVTAKQDLSFSLIKTGTIEKTKDDTLTTLLTFYKAGKSWSLGKVELK